MLISLSRDIAVAQERKYHQKLLEDSIQKDSVMTVPRSGGLHLAGRACLWRQSGPVDVQNPSLLEDP